MNSSVPPSTHDLQNALLFLDTFPLILEQSLRHAGSIDDPEVQELLKIYSEKIGIVKAGVRT